eukprot:3470909-Amphidinium_carterae.1
MTSTQSAYKTIVCVASVKRKNPGIGKPPSCIGSDVVTEAPARRCSGEGQASAQFRVVMAPLLLVLAALAMPRTVEGISNVPPTGPAPPPVDQTACASCNSCWPPPHQLLWGDLTCEYHLGVAYSDAWGCAVMPAPLYCHPPAVVTGHLDVRMGTFGPEVRADAPALRGDLTA